MDELTACTSNEILPPSLVLLPLDVLLKIFSLLPLRSVLQLECLCYSLHNAVSSYLAVLKSLNFSHTPILHDDFQHYHPAVATGPSHYQLRALLDRCPRVSSLISPPPDAEALAMILTNKHIPQVCLCESVSLLDSISQHFPEVTIVTLRLTKEASLSLSPLSRIQELYLRNITLLTGLPSLPFTEVVSLINVRLCQQIDKPLDFPCLSSLELSLQREKSMEEVTMFNALVVALASSPCLKKLSLTLRDFVVLRRLAELEQLNGLQELTIQSAGPYTAAFQQYSFAGTIAEICAMSASTLKHINLPSSVLVKQLFTYFSSNNILLPQLCGLEANGIADTKLFIAPGNLVEAHYYQNFLNMCPAMESLSLHTYSGSLSALPLPLSLTELTLPWDNRLSLSRQRDDIVASLASMVNLRKLAIAGVEEVEAVVSEGRIFMEPRRLPSLQLSIPHLEDFRISNTCLSQLNLKGCSHLRRFTLHCCPSLETLHLSPTSLERVNIYEPFSSMSYLSTFLSEFSTQGERSQTCHIHIQFHAIVKASESGTQPVVLPDIGDISPTRLRIAQDDKLDFMILRKKSRSTIEHNSGERLFACTELHPHPHCSSRSFEVIEQANAHRSLALRGISRWVRCISKIKKMANLRQNCPEPSRSKQSMSYCSEPYDFFTNMDWVLEMSNASPLSQPSGVPTGSLPQLCVPRIHVPPAQYSHAIPSLADRVRSLSPLLVVTIMEYVHIVHTLFYYT